MIYKTSSIYSKKGGNTYQKFKEFDKGGKYDIIVVGSSLAYRGYDPRIFAKEGIKMFNLGTSGQSFLNTYFVSKNYITNENCKLVILDIADDCFASDGFESSSDLIGNVNSNRVAIDMATAYTNPQIMNLIALRFYNILAPPAYIDSSYVGNGFSQNEMSIKEKIAIDSNNSLLLPQKKQIEYLEKTIKYFKSIKLPILFVTHPISKEKKKEQHEIVFGIVYSICKKNNIEYFDYSYNHELDSQKHFYDVKHLNQAGVNVFNRALLKDLKQIYHK